MAFVLEYLQGRGHVFTVIPRLRTATNGAPASQVPAELVAMTIVVVADHGPALLVIPASRMLDLELVAEAVGDPAARLATERELDTWFPDYELGALPPLSMLLLVPTYVDPAVVERPEIVFAAGRQDVSIKMTTHDLFGNDPVVIAPLTTESRVAAPT
ncbi:MAG TPA: YbaK/EbsC family protein [Actinomycetota bacterium]|jgi:Ala-tRNA(Pro) deacylase